MSALDDMVLRRHARPLSENAKILLLEFCDNIDRPAVDAAICADELAELLDLGFIVLQGTFSSASLAVTKAGEAHAALLRSAP